MPLETQRHHFDPPWVGDCYRGLLITSHDHLGPDRIRAIDTNYQCTSDGEVCAHWGTARKNGCYWIVSGHDKNGKEIRRPMSNLELDRPIIMWKTATVLRWRRTEHDDGTFSGSWRIHTFEEMVIKAKALGVVICAELKSNIFATDPNRAVKMKKVVDKHKATVFVMALVVMPKWAGKMKAFHNAGFQTALLAHGAKKPITFPLYKKYVTRVWGKWA